MRCFAPCLFMRCDIVIALGKLLFDRCQRIEAMRGTTVSQSVASTHSMIFRSTRTCRPTASSIVTRPRSLAAGSCTTRTPLCQVRYDLPQSRIGASAPDASGLFSRPSITHSVFALSVVFSCYGKYGSFPISEI